MNHIVLSFIGQDQAGLVNTLSNTIQKHQGNWQTSSMHHVSGLFAGIIEIAVEESHLQNLVSALKEIKTLNCQIEIAAPNTERQVANLVLELTANDRYGIVQDISSVIHEQGGNLIKLVSTQESAAYSGQLMFKAKAKVCVNDKNVDNLVSAIESIADDIMVDILRD
ncbi:MAG: glycine cleavage system regulatory protein [Alteromonadaceae bacterium]|jgi:glycine cleavage system regulatory protein|tara:strand:+ start:613 stop:1113 length:501 start_codon:yes stop_codon:yes gene_type:complete